VPIEEEEEEEGYSVHIKILAAKMKLPFLHQDYAKISITFKT
jgi:hypothetical protein